MNEADFIRRVANRLGRAEPLRAGPRQDVGGVPDFWRTYRMQEEDRVAAFSLNFERQGGEVRLVADAAALPGAVAELLRAAASRATGVWAETLSEWPGLSDALVPYGLRVAEKPDGADRAGADVAARREALRAWSEVEASVTGCACAVADTGTLVIAHGPGRPRGLSLLPALHAVIVRRGQIVTRLGEALARMAPPEGMLCEAANVLFMSGPSRSSDIQNDLTIGVHGPARVVAFLVGQPEGSGQTDPVRAVAAQAAAAGGKEEVSP